MLKKILNKITITLALAGAFTMPLVPSAAFAQTKEDICRGVGLAGGTANCAEPDTGPTVNSTVRLVISILSFLVGVAAVIMIIIGGFKYVTSSGDSNNITSAKNTILYAVIGLVVAVLAQVLVRFVINQAAPASLPTPIVILDSPKAPPSPDQLISADSGLPSIDVAKANSPSVKSLSTRADLPWERAILGKSSRVI